MKKLLALLLVVAMMAAMLVGCGSKPAEPAENAKKENGSTDVAEVSDLKEKYKGEEIIVYSRFMESDAKWMADTVWPEFEKEYGVKIIYKQFENPADLLDMLELEKGNNTATIFAVSDAIAPQLVAAGLVAPTSEYDVDGSYTALYTDESIVECSVDGTQYFTPWTAAAYATLYLKEPVADAVANWSSMKDEISEMLKSYNGYGLPDSYQLEEDVNLWDTYDLAVVGYYWAHTEYNGITAPRIAHRAKKYDGTITELTSKAYQLGATKDDIVKMDSQGVADMFAWETCYADGGVYIPEMWSEGWTGGNVYQAMADGSCYLAFMHVQDAFTIHGLGTPDMPGYLIDPDEMGVALSVAGSSLEIADGEPARVGPKATTKWCWNWGVTADSPNKELSFELIKWMMTGKDEFVTRWVKAGQDVPLKDFAQSPKSIWTSSGWLMYTALCPSRWKLHWQYLLCLSSPLWAMCIWMHGTTSW